MILISYQVYFMVDYDNNWLKFTIKLLGISCIINYMAIYFNGWSLNYDFSSNIMRSFSLIWVEAVTQVAKIFFLLLFVCAFINILGVAISLLNLFLFVFTNYLMLLGVKILFLSQNRFVWIAVSKIYFSVPGMRQI